MYEVNLLSDYLSAFLVVVAVTVNTVRMEEIRNPKRRTLWILAPKTST